MDNDRESVAEAVKIGIVRSCWDMVPIRIEEMTEASIRFDDCLRNSAHHGSLDELGSMTLQDLIKLVSGYKAVPYHDQDNSEAVFVSTR